MNLKDLGFAIGRGKAHQNEYYSSIELVTPSYTDEYGFTPAQSTKVSGVKNIKALIELCEETLRETEELKKAVTY